VCAEGGCSSLLVGERVRVYRDARDANLVCWSILRVNGDLLDRIEHVVTIDESNRKRGEQGDRQHTDRQHRRMPARALTGKVCDAIPSHTAALHTLWIHASLSVCCPPSRVTDRPKIVLTLFKCDALS
jgi:hypothetical protein